MEGKERREKGKRQEVREGREEELGRNKEGRYWESVRKERKEGGSWEES